MPASNLAASASRVTGATDARIHNDVAKSPAMMASAKPVT
jgi:hypothetical protein